MTNGAPLDGDQRNHLAAQHFEFARKYLASRIGDEYADETVGEAFYRILSRYQSADGDFRDFLVIRLQREAVQVLRHYFGREGSAKRRVTSEHTSLDINDRNGEAFAENIPDRSLPTILDIEGKLGALQKIDRMSPPHRWQTLARFCDIDTPSDLNAIINRPTFQALDEFLDTMMLSGASIIPAGEGKSRLKLTHPRDAMLAFLVIQAERHGIRMSAITCDEFSIEYRSDVHPFMSGAYRRWFNGFPDLDLTENMLAFWMASSYSQDGTIAMTSPNLTAAPAVQIANAIAGFNPEAVHRPRSKQYSIVIRSQVDAERWLASRIPRAVWSVV